LRLFTKQLASHVGVTTQTIYRWLKAGKISEPPRDRNGWRVWEDDQIKAVMNYANQRFPPTPQSPAAPSRRRKEH
jgi:predicted site-specific integrase-resolvase